MFVDGRLLKLGSESFDNFGDFMLEYLKRLYDKRPIFERYVEGEIEVHLHFDWNGSGWCFRYRGLNDGHGGLPSRKQDTEVFVFVFIGEGPQCASPFASIARLVLLDHCDMFSADAVKEGLEASRESLYRIFDRKLRSRLLNTRIETRQVEHQVIQGAAEIVNDLTGDGGKQQRNLDHGGGLKDRLSDMKVVIGAEAILADLSQVREPLLQIKQMFTCPIYSCVTPDEVVVHGV